MLLALDSLLISWLSGATWGGCTNDSNSSTFGRFRIGDRNGFANFLNCSFCDAKVERLGFGKYCAGWIVNFDISRNRTSRDAQEKNPPTVIVWEESAAAISSFALRFLIS